MKSTASVRDERRAIPGKTPSATVRGSGELSGGDYDKILILGSGEIAGDVRANRLRSFGAAELQGRTDVGNLFVAGAGEISSDLIAGRVKAIGAFKVEGNAEARTLFVMGACEIGGRVLVEEASVYGAFEARSVETGRFLLRGVAKIDGLLSGDSVELHLGGMDSCVDDIGGERVEVWRYTFGDRNPLLKALGWLSNPCSRAYLQVSTVEADDVALENTRARTVRGKRVRIGPGCEINEVEYEETLTVHMKAEVGKRSKR